MTMTRTLAVALLCLSACKTAEVKPEGPPPTVNEETLALSVVEQTLTQVQLRLSGTVKLTEPSTVTALEYEFVVDGKVVKKGTEQIGKTGEANGEVPFQIEETSQYVASAEDLKAMDSRGGSILMSLRGVVKVQAGTKTHSIEVARSREVRTPRLPHMRFQEYEAGRYSDDEAGVTFHIGVNNPNPFTVKVTKIHYVTKMGGKQIHEGDIGAGEKVNGNSTGVFDLEAKMTQESHGAEVKKLIKSRQIPYEVSGQLESELFTDPFKFEGTINLPAAK